MAKYRMPNLENATPEMLVDEMGRLSAIESYVKKLRAFYKQAYFGRTGIDPEQETLLVNHHILNGEMFIADTGQHYRTNNVDLDKLRAEYPEVAAACAKPDTLVTTIRAQLKPEIDNPAVNDLLNQLKAELDLD